jgi:hypothetical protein
MTRFGFEIDGSGWFEIADREWINRRTALLLVDVQNYAVTRRPRRAAPSRPTRMNRPSP